LDPEESNEPTASHENEEGCQQRLQRGGLSLTRKALWHMAAFVSTG